MKNKIMTGKQIVDNQLKIIKHRRHYCVRPVILAIIQANPRSTYIKMIKRTAHRVGIKVQTYNVPIHQTKYPNKDAFELHNLIDRLNENPKITGILIPKQHERHDHIDYNLVDTWIEPYKDVDGVSERNTGSLYKGLSGIFPATAEAVENLMVSNLLFMNGTSVAILNRTQTVGLPLAIKAIHRNAETMVFNHFTNKQWLKHFHIIIAATGKPDLIKAKDINKDSILIPVSEIPEKDGIHGDFSQGAMNKAKLAFKPTGNVGPLCIENLMMNCLEAYNWQSKIFQEY